jgi:hypothetical protein
VGISVGAVIGLLLAGRYLLNPLFQIIARTGAREAMIAAALFVVLARRPLMEYAGFSMAMGAFLAGVMLAESSYRHELEADIEPFRGILLGLFFMAVGLSLRSTSCSTTGWSSSSPCRRHGMAKSRSSTASAACAGSAPDSLRRHCCCRKAANSASCCSPRPRRPASSIRPPPRC